VSANRRQRAARPRQRSAPAPAPAAATSLESQIKREVTARIRRRLGLAERESVPEEIQGIVDSVAREIVESSVSNAVIQEVETVVKRLGSSASVSDLPLLQEAEHLAATDLPLLQEAEHLAAKKKALQATGFSSEEAMRILVAEVSGRAKP
jgi:5-methylthioribose kinase